MTIHAVGIFHTRVVMAAVAEFGLAGVALRQAGARQPYIVDFAVEGFVLPDVFPHIIIPPIQQQLHVRAFHKLRRRHALSRVFREHKVGGLNGLPGSEIVGKRESNHGQE